MLNIDQAIQKPRFVIYTISTFILCVLIWAYVSQLEKVVVTQGSIKPGKDIQEIQSLEGGIIREVYIKTGDKVIKNQKLIRLDDIAFKAALNEQLQELSRLNGHIYQLQAELSSSKDIQENGFSKSINTEIFADSSLSEKEKRNALAAYSASIKSLKFEVHSADQRVIQAKQTLNEALNHLKHLKNNLKIAKKELNLNRPAYQKGAISGVEILKLERNVSDTQAELDATRYEIKRDKKKIDEEKSEQNSVIAKFITNTQEKLNEKSNEYAQLQANHAAIKDKVARSIITSPVAGIVKAINVNTKGGVIQSGETMIEIVPLNTKLLVEVKISPQDIGSLRVGLPTLIKLSAFDFIIYGGLEGTLTHISADTILDEEGNAFYIGHVEIAEAVSNSGHLLDIIPGMQASVDIIAGTRTVMQYWLKPILRAQSNAMREI